MTVINTQEYDDLPPEVFEKLAIRVMESLNHDYWNIQLQKTQVAQTLRRVVIEVLNEPKDVNDFDA